MQKVDCTILKKELEESFHIDPLWSFELTFFSNFFSSLAGASGSR